MDIFENYHLLSLFVIVFEGIVCYRVGSRCGFPGLPYDTQIEPKKTIYDDGEEVRYSCPKDEIYVKTQVKKCEEGLWTGPRSTCGYFIRNQLNRVKVIDLNANKTIVDINTSNITDKEYPVAYFENKGTYIQIPSPHRPHKWYFEFETQIFFDFFLINLRIPLTPDRHKIPINEMDAIRVTDVVVLNQENRTCTLDFRTRRKWEKIFWFWCSESKERPVNKTLAISFKTFAIHEMKVIGLMQVYLTKLQYCGQPPIPLFAKFNPRLDDNQQVICDRETSFDVRSSDNTSDLILSDEENEYLDCIDNQYWAGNPKCVPKIHCKRNHNTSSETISFVKNAYKINETQWLAIDRTTVHYKCKSGYELIGNSVRTCIACPECKNASWDQNGRVCTERITKLHTSTLGMSSNTFWAIVLAAIVIIIAIISLVVIIGLKVNKRNQLTVNERKREINIYDDINDFREEYYEYGYDKDNGYSQIREDQTVEPNQRAYLSLEDDKQYGNQYETIYPKESSI